MAWVDPRTWVGGETITAAKLNEIRDALKALGDPWTTYTPTWTSGGTQPAIGNGTRTGRYIKAGRLVHFEINLVMGSTTTYGTGSYSLGLPTAARSSTSRRPFLGALWDASDSGTATYQIVGSINGSASAVDLWALPVVAGNTYRTLSGTNVITIANGDRITLAGTYESAA